MQLIPVGTFYIWLNSPSCRVAYKVSSVMPMSRVIVRLKGSWFFQGRGKIGIYFLSSNSSPALYTSLCRRGIVFQGLLDYKQASWNSIEFGIQSTTLYLMRNSFQFFCKLLFKGMLWILLSIFSTLFPFVFLLGNKEPS